MTLFFALSGFLLYRPYAKAALDRTTAPTVGAYLNNRAVRILPAYIVILGLCLWVFHIAYRGPDGTLSVRELLQAATLTQDLTPSTLGVGLGPAWSLTVEAEFYLLLTLLGLVAMHLARRSTTFRGRAIGALLPCAFMLVVGLIGKFVAGHVVTGADRDGNTWHAVIVRGLFGQADLFTFGMALAVAHVAWTSGRLQLPAWLRKVTIIAIVVLAGALSNIGGAGLDYTPRNTVVGLVAALVVSLIVFAPKGSRLVAFLETRWMFNLGLISYSVFLWNMDVVRWLRKEGLTSEGWGGLLVNLVVAGIAVLVLSTLTYHFVERPSMAWLRARRKRPLPVAQVATAP